MSQLTSSLGRHSRYVVTSAEPAIIKNLRAPSAIAVQVSAGSTASLELSISHPASSPIWVPSSLGVIPADTTVMEVVPCKVSAIRVNVTGTGTAAVEVLE